MRIGKSTMNLDKRKLLGAPDLALDCCAVCGRKWPLNNHHVIFRSAGNVFDEDGKALRKPVVTLCGSGNASGCHKKAHDHSIEFDYDEARCMWKWRRKGATAWHVCHGQELWKTYGGK